MQHLTYKPGQIIFREGEDSDAAYYIASGTVEIYKRGTQGTILLAELGQGEIFGEMGIISSRPRSAYAAAKTPVELTVISRDALAQVLHGQHDIVIRLLRTLMERLHEANAMNAAIIDKQAGFQLSRDGISQTRPVTKMKLLPLTAETKRFLPAEGMELQSLPFRVGALGPGEAANPLDWNNLQLEAPEGAPISRNHFVIQKGDFGLSVMDRGSRAGTVVNGTAIGGATGVFKADLAPGDNLIAAGAADSPYRFMLVWE